MCCRFQIVILDRPQTITSNPYFQFKKIFDFIFVNDEYTQMLFCVYLPDIMENSENCRGKVIEFYSQLSV